MKVEIHACLFDLDGVIVDTARYHYIAWREIASELGFNFTEEHNEKLKGVSRMRSLEILLETGEITLDETTKARLADRKNNRYVELISQLTPQDILPGALEFLKECRDIGLKTGLGSASKNAMSILNSLQITDLFDAVIDGTKVSEAKPNPEVFLKGAEVLHIDPKRCVVFEDAEAGVEAALNGGMLCIGVGQYSVLGRANIVIANLKGFTVKKMFSLLT